MIDREERRGLPSADSSLGFTPSAADMERSFHVARRRPVAGSFVLTGSVEVP